MPASEFTFHTRLLQAQDAQPIAAAFKALDWNKPVAQYERYLAEQSAGSRTVIVAFADTTFAGYITISWLSDYPPFQTENIPEIQDFNVLPAFRRRGLGGRLMDETEQLVAAHAPVVGIGVGLYADYGSAQRLYARRGYIPDGRGLFFEDRFVQAGESVVVNDNLTLHFTRQL